MSSTIIYDEIQTYKQKLIEYEDKIYNQKQKLNKEYNSEEEFMDKKNRYFARWDNEVLRAKSIISFSEENRLAKRYLVESKDIIGDLAVEKHMHEIENTHKKIRSVIENDEYILERYKTKQNALMDTMLSLESQYQIALDYESDQTSQGVNSDYLYS